MRAVGATKDVASCLDTVANDPAATMFAFGSERVNGAFETIEGVRTTAHRDLECLLVVVSADVAT